MDELNVLVECERPAAGGHDSAFEMARGTEHVALALAKVALTVLREDVLDRDLLRRFDQLIEIEKGSADARRQLAPDGRLAGAHEADQVDFHV